MIYLDIRVDVASALYFGLDTRVYICLFGPQSRSALAGLQRPGVMLSLVSGDPNRRDCWTTHKSCDRFSLIFTNTLLILFASTACLFSLAVRIVVPSLWPDHICFCRTSTEQSSDGGYFSCSSVTLCNTPSRHGIKPGLIVVRAVTDHS